MYLFQTYILHIDVPNIMTVISKFQDHFPDTRTPQDFVQFEFEAFVEYFRRMQEFDKELAENCLLVEFDGSTK